MRTGAPITISTAAGTLYSTNVDNSLDPAVWNNAVTYAQGGTARVGDYIYESAQGGNTNHDPLGAGNIPTWWVKKSAINALAMFDQRLGLQTVRADTIVANVRPLQVVNYVSLRNIVGKKAHIVQTDLTVGGDGIVLDEEINLVEPVRNWYEYWFKPVKLLPDAMSLNLKPYRNCNIEVTIDNTGSTAKCGELLMCLAEYPGDTQRGWEDGIQDYSRITPDAWGIYDITPRTKSDEVEMVVWVKVAFSALFKRYLTDRSTLATMFLTSESRSDTQVFGLPSFRRIGSYADVDVFKVTVKGFP